MCSNVAMTASVIAILVSCALQIVSRYVMRRPLFWTEEFARVMFIWLTYWGSVVAVREHQHVSIPILTEMLNKNTQRTLAMVRAASLAILCVIVGWAGILLMMQNRGIATPAVRIPLALYYLPVAVGAAFMFVHFVEQLGALTKSNAP